MGTGRHAFFAGVLLLLFLASPAVIAEDAAPAALPQGQSLPESMGEALSLYAQALTLVENATSVADLKSAAALLEQAAKADPESVEIRKILVQVLSAIGDSGRLFRESMSLAELVGADAGLWADAFRLARRAGDVDAFRRCGEKLMELGEPHAKVRSSFVVGFAEMDDFAAAYSEFVALVDEAKSADFKPPAADAERISKLAVAVSGVEKRKGRKAEGISAKLFYIAAGVLETPAARADLYVNAGYVQQMRPRPNVEAAKALYLKAALENPIAANVLAVVLGDYGAMPEYDELAETIRRLDAHPRDPVLDYAFAMTKAGLYEYYSQSREAWREIENAEAALKRSFPESPEPARFLEIQGPVLYALDKTNEAFAVADKALEMYPDDASVQNTLAYMLAVDGRDLDRALDLIDSAMRSMPSNPAFLDTLAWVLYRKGDLEGALRSMMECMSNGGDAYHTSYDHIGDILRDKNSVAEAVPWWTKSYLMFPDEKVRAKLQGAGVDTDKLK